MKLLRYGPPGNENPALLDNQGAIRDLSPEISDLSEENLTPETLDRLAQLDPESLQPVSGKPRIAPCVGHVGKLMCILIKRKGCTLL